MKTLQLTIKENTPFISNTGSAHSNAILIVSGIENQIIDKRLTIRFLMFNSINDLDKTPIDGGFLLEFDTQSIKKTITNPDTGAVIQWGYPSYTEVLSLFDIVDDGIVLTSPQAEYWLLESVNFKNQLLGKNWELIK
jgi:hypothetical protein